jgi:hypothetical protein
MAITVTQIEYHRNGISGVGFYACRFTCPENGEMLATVFLPQDENLRLAAAGEFFEPMVAVYQVEQLPDVTFGVNSWRGDNYADALYEEIARGDYGSAREMFESMVEDMTEEEE